MGLRETISTYLSAGWKQSSASLSEWLTLLGGPVDPPFCEAADFTKEWGRLTRLTVIVVVLVGAVWGIEYAISDLKPNNRLILEMLLGGAIAAILYRSLFAPIFRIKVSLYDAFFIILLLGLPWLPIIAAVRAFAMRYSGNPLAALLVVVALFVISFSLLLNVSRGFARVSRCPLWRVLLSVLLPLALLVYVILRLHVTPMPAPAPQPSPRTPASSNSPLPAAPTSGGWQRLNSPVEHSSPSFRRAGGSALTPGWPTVCGFSCCKR
jgi:hypothetical protein